MAGNRESVPPSSSLQKALQLMKLKIIAAKKFYRLFASYISAIDVVVLGFTRILGKIRNAFFFSGCLSFSGSCLNIFEHRHNMPGACVLLSTANSNK